MGTGIPSLPFRIHVFLITSALFSFVSSISLLKVLNVSYFEVIGGKTVVNSFSASLTGDAILDLGILVLLSAATAFLFVRFSGLPMPVRLLLASVFLSSFAMLLSGLELLGYCLVCFLGLQLTWELLQGLQRRYLVSDRRLLIYDAAYLVTILTIIGSVSAVFLLLGPVVRIDLAVFPHALVELDSALFHVLSGLSPYIFVLILLMPILNKVIHRFTASSEQLTQSDPHRVANEKIGILLLAAGVLTSILGGIYPFLPAIDLSKSLGVDFKYYLEVIETFDKQGFTLETLSLTSVYSGTGFYRYDRVLSNAFLILVYYVSQLPAALAINTMPLLLGPLFVLSSYLLGSELFGRNLFSGMCAYIAATCYTVTIGLFAGYYGNWQANAVLMLLLWAILRWQRIRNTGALIGAMALSVVLFLTHTYTWLISMGMLVPFLAFEINSSLTQRGRRITRKHLLFLGILVTILALVDYSRMSLLDLPSILVVGLTMLSRAGLSGGNIIALNRNLGTTFFAYAAGFPSNYLLLSLAAVGSYFVPGNPRLKWIFAPFITLCMVLFTFADPFTMQGRILYTFPIVPLSALGLVGVTGFVRSSLGNDESSNHVSALIAAFVVVEQLTYLLRSMGILAELRLLS